MEGSGGGGGQLGGAEWSGEERTQPTPLQCIAVAVAATACLATMAVPLRPPPAA